MQKREKKKKKGDEGAQGFSGFLHQALGSTTDLQSRKGKHSVNLHFLRAFAGGTTVVFWEESSRTQAAIIVSAGETGHACQH